MALQVFFEVGGYNVNDKVSGLDKSVGHTLLEPHTNYTNHVFSLINSDIPINGIAHITGGGLSENIPRILPKGLAVELQTKAWPALPVFSSIQSIGQINKNEMFRTFNMGIGMIIILNKNLIKEAKTILNQFTTPYEIGKVVPGNMNVHLL